MNSKRIAVIGAVSALLGTGAVRGGERLQLGTNRTNLQWVQPAARQFEILDEIKAMGALNIRLSWVEPYGPVREHIAYCNRIGLGVSVMIVPHPERHFPEGSIRPGNDHLFHMPRLSRLDTGAWLDDFRREMERWRETGLQVEALEMFNEINWADFNGDLPEVDGGLILTATNFSAYPFFDDWAKGMVKYSTVLEGARRVADEVYGGIAGKPLLLSAGYPFPPPAWLAKARGSVVEPGFFVDILAGKYPQLGISRDCFQFVDGYALHIYPKQADLNPETGQATAAAAVRRLVDPLTEVVGTDKPFHITEWNYTGWLFGGGQRDEIKRRDQMDLFMKALAGTHFSDLKWGMIQQFDYDQVPPQSVYENGRLLPAASIFTNEYRRNRVERDGNLHFR